MDSMRPLRLQLLALTAALVAAGTVSDGGSGAPASTPAADAALFSAVNKDSRMRIERALDDGADINAQDSKTGYFTPLMLAAQKGQGNAVPILLERGADTERADKDGFTAMHVAAFHGEWGVVQLLINHGVDPDIPCKYDGLTPIFRACWGEHQHHTDTVNVLLHAGVEFDTPMGEPARLPITMTKRRETRELLIRAKERADPNFVAPPKPEEEEAEGTGGTGEGSPKQEL